MSASAGLTIAEINPRAAALRVACVIDTMRPGGAERVCARLADGVRAHGGGAFVYELAPHASESGRDGRWPVMWKLLTWLREQQINVIHAHNSAAFVYSLGPAKLLGMPIVVTRHGALIGPPPRAARWAERLLPMAECVVIVADALRTALPGRMCPDRIVQIANGVPTGRMDRTTGRRRLHALTATTGPAEWVVTVGSVSPEKDPPGMVRAFARVASDRPAAQLVVVGATRCGATLAETQRMADAAGLAGRVHLVGAQDDVPTLLAGADAFVLGSRTEAMPMALLEAMVQTCPIVATRVGDVPRVVRCDLEALLVEPGDDEALGAAISRLLADPALGRRLGAAARLRVCDLYSEDRMVREHVRLYATLAGVRCDGR